MIDFYTYRVITFGSVKNKYDSYKYLHYGLSLIVFIVFNLIITLLSLKEVCRLACLGIEYDYTQILFSPYIRQ